MLLKQIKYEEPAWWKIDKQSILLGLVLYNPTSNWVVRNIYKRTINCGSQDGCLQ